MINNVTQIRMEGTKIPLTTVTSQNAPHPVYMVGDEIDVQDYDMVITGRRWKSPDYLIIYVKHVEGVTHEEIAARGRAKL